MPQMSGSFSGTAKSQASLAIDDQPGHELALVQITGVQRSLDPLRDGAAITYWGEADLVGGNGPQRGYFVNRRGADSNCGTFEAKISTAAGVTTLEGTWRFPATGTGQYSGLSGHGTFRGRMTSPSEVETTWEGSYEAS